MDNFTDQASLGGTEQLLRKCVYCIVLSDNDEEKDGLYDSKAMELSGHVTPSLSSKDLTSSTVLTGSQFRSIQGWRGETVLEMPIKKEEMDLSPCTMVGNLVNTMHKGWPKASDYPSGVRAILDTAIEIYCAVLLTKNPFPTTAKENDWAKGAWTLACGHHKKSVMYDIGLLKLVGRSHHPASFFLTYT